MTRKTLTMIGSAGAVVLLSTAGAAYAASMVVTSSDLGAGRGSVGTCQTGTVTTSWVPGTDVVNTGAGWTIASIRVSGVSAACAGKPIHLTLVRDATTSPVVPASVLVTAQGAVPSASAGVIAPFSVPVPTGAAAVLAEHVSKVDVLIPS